MPKEDIGTRIDKDLKDGLKAYQNMPLPLLILSWLGIRTNPRYWILWDVLYYILLIYILITVLNINAAYQHCEYLKGTFQFNGTTIITNITGG